ncbi:MAG: PfkB family carbohydrate kinase [Sphaerochaetaceae bacterium]|nr:PfkB family carbohydrate kinase [Sphaerochaetaceae bacterium]
MKYDIVMIGHVSKDIMIYKEDVNEFLGGPVIYSSIAATKANKKIKVITVANVADAAELQPMIDNGVDVTRLDSEKTTSIKNVYFSADKEKREVTLLSRAENFDLKKMEKFDTRIVHLAGLFRDEIPDEFIEYYSKQAAVGIDAQGLLRTSVDNDLKFINWADIDKYAKYITYLKTDAAEAEILTGLQDREMAAKALCDRGIKEVMVTHNTEVLVYSEGKCYTAPFNPSNLSGRTGRGDTTFAAYLSKRLDSSIQDSVDYAAALCSMKMEKQGPFSGTYEEVMERVATLRVSK